MHRLRSKLLRWSAVMALWALAPVLPAQQIVLFGGAEETLNSHLNYSFAQGDYYFDDSASANDITIDYRHRAISAELPLTQRLFFRARYLNQSTDFQASDGAGTYEDSGRVNEGEVLLGWRAMSWYSAPAGQTDLTLAVGYYRGYADLATDFALSPSGQSGTQQPSELGERFSTVGGITEIGLRSNLGVKRLQLSAHFRAIAGEGGFYETGVRAQAGYALTRFVRVGYTAMVHRDDVGENILTVPRHGVFARIEF